MSGGYPADTPVSEMTLEEQVAYWKHHSRVHEGRLRDRWDDPVKLQERLTALTSGAAQPEAESPEAPEAEAENEAWAAAQAERTELRRSALRGEFISATGHPSEFFDAVMPHLLVNDFYNDDGSVDRDRVSRAVKHFTPKASAPTQPWNTRVDDPIAAAMNRLSN